MSRRLVVSALAIALLLSGCRTSPVDVRSLPISSPGSWIVVGGADHPLAREARVEQVLVAGPRTHAIAILLDAIDRTPRVRPVAYLERELEFVEETDQPGIGDLRTLLHALLLGVEVRQLPLAEILLCIDEATEEDRIALIVTEGPPHAALAIELRARELALDS